MGEPTRVVVGGLPNIPGNTMAEKIVYAKNNLNHIRTFLMHEPRGHRDMFGAIITAPVNKDADLGVIFIDSDYFLNMCGHGTIGVVTTAIETGMVEAKNPITKVAIDTPPGLVTCYAKVENDKVTGVSFQNVPSFHYGKYKINLPKIGDITVNISFGGNFFAIVEADELKETINPNNSAKLIELGTMVRKTINEKVKVSHPEFPHINTVDLTEISCKLADDHYQNVVILGAGQVDRSPCGTGTCAQLANLYHWEKLDIGKEMINESIINTKFKGKILKTTKIGEFEGIIPEITGRAFITGYHQFVTDPEDPVKYGFWVG
jgi:proline racemase